MEDKFKSVGDILRDILPKEVFETPTIPQQIEMIFAPNAEATWKDEDGEFDPIFLCPMIPVVVTRCASPCCNQPRVAIVC